MDEWGGISPLRSLLGFSNPCSRLIDCPRLVIENRVAFDMSSGMTVTHVFLVLDQGFMSEELEEGSKGMQHSFIETIVVNKQVFTFRGEMHS